MTIAAAELMGVSSVCCLCLSVAAFLYHSWTLDTGSGIGMKLLTRELLESARETELLECMRGIEGESTSIQSWDLRSAEPVSSSGLSLTCLESSINGLLPKLELCPLLGRERNQYSPSELI